MRLLHTTEYRFEEFYVSSSGSATIPKYAILSHRWGPDEVSYQEFLYLRGGDDIVGTVSRSTAEAKRQGAGYRKILDACKIAAPSHSWIWIDTCCIDKTSSAELTEAINSMWNWYEDSAICFVHICDLNIQVDPIAALAKSSWFRRGWTLQELLAPSTVYFYDNQWNPLGDKKSLHEYITEATGIAEHYIKHRNSLFETSANTRMTWAASRETTRIEDQAYSLLGLFRVNMPLLYGEGKQAFHRLQRAILEKTSDESVLAHKHPPPTGNDLHPLAFSPADFVLRKPVSRPAPWLFYKYTDIGSHHFVLTSRGLQMRAAIVPTTTTTTEIFDSMVVALNCRFQNDNIPILLELFSRATFEHASGLRLIRNRRREPWSVRSLEAVHGWSAVMNEAVAKLRRFVESNSKKDPFVYKDIYLSW